VKPLHDAEPFGPRPPSGSQPAVRSAFAMGIACMPFLAQRSEALIFATLSAS
jgi:hypothetical protein